MGQEYCKECMNDGWAAWMSCPHCAHVATNGERRERSQSNQEPTKIADIEAIPQSPVLPAPTQESAPDAQRHNDPEFGLARAWFVVKMVLLPYGSTAFVLSAIVIMVVTLAVPILYYAALKGTARRSLPWDMPWLWDALLPWMIWTIATALLAVFVVGWLRSRRRLYEFENFIVLTLIAILGSASHGLVNHLIFSYSPDSFYIEQETAEAALEFRRTELTATKNRVERALVMLDSVEKALSGLSRLEVRSVEYSSDLLGVGTNSKSVWEIGPFVSGIKLLLGRVRMGGNVNMERRTIFWLYAADGLDSVELGTSSLTDSYRFLGDGVQYVESGPVLKAIKSTAEEKYALLHDVKRQMELLDRRFAKPSVAFFMYQSMMSILGDDPQHVKPSGFWTRVLSLVFACARFFFFGAIIAILSQRWARPLEKK